jgi:hypothetical protein
MTSRAVPGPDERYHAQSYVAEQIRAVVVSQIGGDLELHCRVMPCPDQPSGAVSSRAEH